MKIAYNMVAKKPGCVNIQAAMGGTVPGFSQLFDAECWQVSLENIKLYEINELQLEKLVEYHQNYLTTHQNTGIDRVNT